MIYGYLRVSSDDQDVNSQKQGVDGFAAKKGWTIEKYISDEGVSGGKDPDKRKLGPMLKALQKDDVIICSEIHRRVGVPRGSRNIKTKTLWDIEHSISNLRHPD